MSDQNDNLLFYSTGSRRLTSLGFQVYKSRAKTKSFETYQHEFTFEERLDPVCRIKMTHYLQHPYYVTKNMKHVYVFLDNKEDAAWLKMIDDLHQWVDLLERQAV